jgi:hypothetical protein
VAFVLCAKNARKAIESAQPGKRKNCVQEDIFKMGLMPLPAIEVLILSFFQDFLNPWPTG